MTRGLLDVWRGGVLGLALAGCATTAMPVPTEADAARVAAWSPGVTVERLAEGRRLYLGRCGACHRPYRPEELTAERWQFEVEDMRERAGLDERGAALVLDYLKAFAAR